MKKNLAKKIVMGLLTGAVLMSSSVAWAYGFRAVDENKDTGGSRALGEWSVTVGYGNAADGVGSVAVGHNSFATGNNSIVIGSNGEGKRSSDGDKGGNVGYDNCIVIGSNSNAGSGNSVALGNGSKVSGTGSVALGYGSYVGLGVENVVSVGSGGSEYITAENAPATRSIINVTDVADADRIAKDSNGKYIYGSYVVNVNTLNEALASVQQQSVDLNNYYNKTETNSALALKANVDDVYTKEQADDKFATIDYVDSTFVKINKDDSGNQKMDTGIFVVESSENIIKTNVVTVNVDGITVGENSTRMDANGFYAGGNKPHNYNNAMAAMTDDGKIKGAGGKFEVGTEGEIKAASGSFKVDASGNVTAEKVTAKEVVAENLYTKEQVNELIGGGNASIAGINQRLDKTNAKINKVGAGAAALAALHPLEYDPDDKLTFSAGMGNYAGENAAALGAFYRPNEKFMVSLGGTMGNGENMVNLGLSIGLDKPNGYAKLSKRELIQKVNAMEAKYEVVEAEKEAMKAEMAEMKAMLQAILAKK